MCVFVAISSNAKICVHNHLLGVDLLQRMNKDGDKMPESILLTYGRIGSGFSCVINGIQWRLYWAQSPYVQFSIDGKQ